MLSSANVVVARWRQSVVALALAVPIALGVPQAFAAQSTAPSAASEPAPASSSAPTANGAAGARDMAAAEEGTAPDSPRASLTRYLELCRTGDFARAAAYLRLPKELEGRGPELARRLKFVLDRYVWFDLSTISGSAEGNRDDHLPPNLEQIATVPGHGGGQDPVRLTKLTRPEGAIWAFSEASVAHIDDWYEALDDRWALENIPERLLRPGPAQLLIWQWIALPFLALVCWLLGFVASRLTRAFLSHAARRTASDWDDALLERVGPPLTLAWTIAAGFLLTPRLHLYAPAHASIERVLHAMLLLSLFWALFRSMDVGAGLLAGSPWARANPASRSLLPLGARISKVGIWVLALIAMLAEFGYPVASLIAGLGIGGLAFALAAQKTVENLFGAFSIGLDQPFREGDFVGVDGMVGTVEAIGLRSTRIRTLDRTLVTLPNGKLADMRLESYAARDRIRLNCTLGMVYETTSAQMQQVLEGIERVLREHPKIWPDAVIVRFQEFAASSLDIGVMAWFQTQDYGEFQLLRQQVFLEFMKVVEQAGTSFAFPTRTVHIANPGALAAPERSGD